MEVSTSASLASSQTPAHGVTLKSILIAVVLIPINCYWVIEMEVIRYSGHPVTISLFFNVIFSLFVVIGCEPIVTPFCAESGVGPERVGDCLPDALHRFGDYWTRYA